MFSQPYKTPTTTPIITQASSTQDDECPWCLQEAGLPQQEGSPDICPRHKAAMELLSDQIKEARAARRAQRGR